MGRMTQKHFPPIGELSEFAEAARTAVARLRDRLAAMKATAADEPTLPP
jgi:hypothetical protein